MKNMKKVCSILLTISMVITMFSPVLASGAKAAAGGDGEVSLIIKPEPSQAVTTFGTMFAKILGFLQYVGYAFAIGMLIYLGIKYVMASANEKADLKKGSINYVIGAIIIVAASTLFGILANFGDNVVGASES